MLVLNYIYFKFRLTIKYKLRLVFKTNNTIKKILNSNLVSIKIVLLLLFIINIILKKTISDIYFLIVIEKFFTK